tara:strand:- start:1449 stop:1625 length:177 start_codon:yes stop_codon:yes gene_type:complete
MRRKVDYNIDEQEPITRELVEKLLRKASLRELNIFYDRNKIIIILCKELLKYIKKEKK